MAIVINTDMRSTNINPKLNPGSYKGDGDGGMEIAAIQGIVGGLHKIDRFTRPVYVDGVAYKFYAVNADRHLRGFDINMVATEVLRKNGLLGRCDYITGPVLLMTEKEAA